MSPDVVVVESTQIQVVEVTPGIVEVRDGVIEVVEVGISGLQGPIGNPGADSTVPGPPGAPGTSFAFVYNQVAPANPWVIVHNLNGFPNITVIDSANSQVEGEVVYNSSNQITVTFSSAFAGKAYLS